MIAQQEDIRFGNG